MGGLLICWESSYFLRGFVDLCVDERVCLCDVCVCLCVMCVVRVCMCV